MKKNLYRAAAMAGILILLPIQTVYTEGMGLLSVWNGTSDSINTLSKIALPIFLIIGGYFIFLARDRKIDEQKLPSLLKLTKGEASRVLNGKVDHRAVNGILFDMINKGYLEMENQGTDQEPNIYLRPVKPGKQYLNVQEQVLFNLFFKKIGDLSGLYLDQIQVFIDDKPGYKIFQDAYRVFSEDIRSKLLDRGYRNKGNRAMPAILFFILVILAGIYALLNGVVFGAMNFILGLMGFVIGCTLYVLPNEQELLHKQQLAKLRSNIRDGGNTGLTKGDEFAYGIALGVKDEDLFFHMELNPLEYPTDSWMHLYRLYTKAKGPLVYVSKFDSSRYPTSGGSGNKKRKYS